MSCPFCGSEKTMIETPYIDRITGEHKKVPCCNAQKKNDKYIKRRYDPRLSDLPTSEEVSKL